MKTRLLVIVTMIVALSIGTVGVGLAQSRGDVRYAAADSKQAAAQQGRVCCSYSNAEDCVQYMRGLMGHGRAGDIEPAGSEYYPLGQQYPTAGW